MLLWSQPIRLPTVVLAAYESFMQITAIPPVNDCTIRDVPLQRYTYCIWVALLLFAAYLRGYVFLKLLLAWNYSCINKKMLLFFLYQGDWYLLPHCSMNNLYISHRSLYAPTYSLWVIGSMLISLFRVTSWLDTGYNIVTRWVNFGENHMHDHEL